MLVKFVDEADETALAESYGLTVKARIGRVLVVSVPMGKIQALADDAQVVRVEAERAGRPMLDLLPSQIGADKAWSGTDNELPQAFTGKDVVVGVVDCGFDYIHPFFRDGDGKTRVTWAADYLTGKKYTTFEDAEAWLADNYESPEDEESEDEGGASDGGESNGETATGEAASGEAAASEAAASETATGEAAPGEQQSESDSGTLPAENRSAAERASNNAATSRSDSATRASRADSGDAGADGDRQDAAEAAAAESDGDDSDGGDSDKIEDLSDDAGDFIDGEEDAEGEEGLEEDEDDGLRPSILPAGAVPAAGLVQ